MKSQRNAITRIELLVIMAIVILLPAVLIATMDSARHLAKIPLCANNLRQISVATYEYAQICDGNIPNARVPLHISSSRDEVHIYVAYRAEHTITPDSDKLQPYRLAYLYEAGLVSDPSIFYCPANTEPRFIYKSYTNPLFPNTNTEWGTLPQQYNTDTQSNQWVRYGYEWYPVDKNPEFQPFPIGQWPMIPEHTCRKFNDVAPDLPYCMDYMEIKDLMSHKYGETLGLNLLFVDGRVVFQDDPNIFSHEIFNLEPRSGDLPAIQPPYYKLLILAGKYPDQGD